MNLTRRSGIATHGLGSKSIWPKAPESEGFQKIQPEKSRLKLSIDGRILVSDRFNRVVNVNTDGLAGPVGVKGRPSIVSRAFRCAVMQKPKCKMKNAEWVEFHSAFFDFILHFAICHYARFMYSPVAVLMRIVSPTRMNPGTRVVRPVSSVASLS